MAKAQGLKSPTIKQKKLSAKVKKKIDAAVKRVFKQYGEVIRRLGKDD